MNLNLNEVLAAQRHSPFSRRGFLRGLGVSLALPTLQSLMPARAFAAESAATGLASTAGGAPLRTAFLFVPNGTIPGAWWPEGGEKDFQMSPSLTSLEAIRKHVQIYSGLDQKRAEAGADGGGDHARGNAVFLTSTRLKKSATDVHAGISIDQVIANQVGHLTRLPSLELTCDRNRKSAGCDSGYSCAYQYNVSWRNESTPMTPESNPRLVFERMFGTGKPGERVANMKRRQMEERSILDFVLDDARSMKGRLGGGDRDKLDQYLTSVREIEGRIQSAERFNAIQDPDLPTPTGIPGGEREYITLMFDMLHLAFQSDSTRVATFILAHDGDNRSFNEIGIPEGHHDLSHHRNDKERMAKVAKIDQWYVSQLAIFLQKMEATRDHDGQSLLQNSMIVYGSGNADGNRHTHTNLPIIIAGGGGGTLNTGRYVKHDSIPMSNLFLSMADRMGLKGVNRFGDSTGRLTDV